MDSEDVLICRSPSSLRAQVFGPRPIEYYHESHLPNRTSAALSLATLGLGVKATARSHPHPFPLPLGEGEGEGISAR